MQLLIAQPKPKAIETWSNKDFVLYYSQKLFETRQRRLEIPPRAWVGFTSRVKAFRQRQTLTPAEYKAFIDDVFALFFRLDGYIPSFNAVVSTRVYEIVTSLRKKKVVQRQDMYNNADFLALRNQLYGDVTLFQRDTTCNRPS